MAEIVELRAFPRFPGEDLVAFIGREFVPIIDISVAGIRIARPQCDLPERNVDFLIAHPSDENNRVISVRGHIVGRGEDHMRIAFAAVTQSLATVIRHYHAEHGERMIAVTARTAQTAAHPC